MKIKRIIFLILVLTCILPFGCSAEEAEYDDFYYEQYELSGAPELYEKLPEDAREYFDQTGINPQNPEWVNTLSPENVFGHIWSFLKSGAKKPVAAGMSILAVTLISATVESMEISGGAALAALYATALSAAAVITAPVLSVIRASVNAMQGCSVFMTAFVPVFAVVVASSGRAVSSVSMSALLLGAAGAVSFISNFVVVPLLGGFLSIGIASSVSPVLARSGIADGIKKIAFWIMSALTTVFVGILGIQTAVNTCADTLSLKTAKFIVGSSVPVAGTALSEALAALVGSMGMLKTSIGIYGVAACCAIFLPLVTELFMWRIILTLNAVVSDVFSLTKISALLRSVDTVISVITGIILLTAAMFVISLSVVVAAGN